MPIEIYSTDTDEGTVSVVQKDQGAFKSVARIPVGNAPRGAVKFTKDGRGYVSNCAGDTISEIDTTTHRENARIKVGPAPRGIGIVPGDRHALVSNSGDNTISVVDLNARREILRLAVGRDPRHMAIDKAGQFAYIAVWGSHYVSKVDIRALASGTAEEMARDVREVTQIKMPQGSHPYSVALHPAGKLLFAANTQSHKLAIVDLATDKVAHEVDLGSNGARAVAFSPDGATAYVTIENVSEIAVLNVGTRTVDARVPTGGGPRGIAIDPKDQSLYIAAFDRTTSAPAIKAVPNSLTVIDMAAHMKAVKALSAPSGPVATGIQFVPVGKGVCSVSVRES